MNGDKLARALDVFADVVWPIMIALAVVAGATYVAGKYAADAVLTPIAGDL
jgi:hypothetical protein